METRPAFVGIDLGGSKIAGALFDADGNLHRREYMLLEKRRGPEVGALILALIGRFMDIATRRQFHLDGIGIGIPGIYFSKTGRVWAPNIQGWEDYPLRDEVAGFLGDASTRLYIDSDRSCSILGEVWKGAAAGCRDAIFLAVGTGIGAGILANGHVIRGSGDVAGAVGWMVLGGAGLPGVPPANFEGYASGQGLAHLAGLLSASGDGSAVAHNQGSVTASAAAIFDAYHAGDPVAAQVIDAGVVYWGRAVANLVSIFNPEKIVFGGGVFGPALELLDRIKGEAEKWAQPISIRQVTLEASLLGSDAAIYGAAYLAQGKEEDC